MSEIKVSKIKYHMLAFLATVLVSGSFIASAELAPILNPISLTLLRFVGSLLFLSPLVLFKDNLRSKILSTMPKAMVISFFYSLFFILFFEALKTTNSLNTSSLYTLVPLITAIFSIFFFKRRISKVQILVYILGIIGTVWVIFKADLDKILSFQLNSGDYIFMLSVVCMSLYSISLKFLYRNDNMSVLVFCTLIGGSIWMFLGLFLFGEDLNWYLVKGDSIFYMLYLILATTLFTMYLYQITTINIGPEKVSAYIYLNPILVAILLFVFYDEEIQYKIIPGIILTALATVILQVYKPKKTNVKI